jgi:hypothetical protein
MVKVASNANVLDETMSMETLLDSFNFRETGCCLPAKPGKDRIYAGVVD